MYLLLIAATFLFSICVAAPPNEDIKKDKWTGILQLNVKNLDKAINENKKIFVLFYYFLPSKYPTQSGAESRARVWSTGEDLKREWKRPNITMGVIDLRGQRGLAVSYNLMHYLTIVYFENGTRTGQRGIDGNTRADEIKKWMSCIAMRTSDCRYKFHRLH